MTAAIHIVTVLFNSAEVLPDFIASLRAQTLPSWRLIAVDNASTDGSAALLEALGDPRILVVRNGANLGFGRATNRGLQAAMDEGGAVFMLLNNDTSFAADFLAEYVATFERIGAEAMAVRVVYRNDPERAWYDGGHFRRGWVFANEHEHDGALAHVAVRPVEFASGCCLGLSRGVLERVGLLDERFFVYWEDSDYCLRLAAAGVVIQYVRALVVVHDASALTGGPRSPTYIRLYYRGYGLFLRKHMGVRVGVLTMLRMLRKHAPDRDQEGRRVWPQILLAMLPVLVLPVAIPGRP